MLSLHAPMQMEWRCSKREKLTRSQQEAELEQPFAAADQEPSTCETSFPAAGMVAESDRPPTAKLVSRVRHNPEMDHLCLKAHRNTWPTITQAHADPSKVPATSWCFLV